MRVNEMGVDEVGEGEMGSLSQRKNGMTLSMLSIQLLDIWTIYSISIVFTHRIYPAELQFNKVNASETEGAF